MKKVVSIFALFCIFTMISCENESVASQEDVYIDSPDTDDVPPIRD